MASTTLVVLVDSAPRAAAHAEGRLRQLEQTWSRFIATSDITCLNHAHDQWVRVSSDTIRLIEAMQLARRATGGMFDPTFLHQLLVAGYTSSIDDTSRITVAVDVPNPDDTIDDVQIDPESSTVLVPPGLSLDPGGIGKGLAADVVVTELLARGTRGALVSIGGDIAAAGQPPSPDGWIVHVENPLDEDSTLATLAVSDGGIATSSTMSRRWRRGGAEMHHVLDPRTGSPSATDLASVTVVANAGWLAEAHATAALLCGSETAIGYLQRRGLTGIAVRHDGAVTSTDDISVGSSPVGSSERSNG